MNIHTFLTIACLFLVSNVAYGLKIPKFWRLSETPKQDTSDEEFRAIDSYLKNRVETVGADNADIIALLMDALEMLKTHSLDGSKNKLSTVDKKFEPFVGHDPSNLKRAISGLLTAPQSCDSEQMSFMATIVDRGTSKGQILNEYASTVLGECWISYVDKFKVKVEIAMGKLKSPLLEYMLEMAKILKDLEGSKDHGAGALRISEMNYEKSASNPRECVKQLSYLNSGNHELSKIVKALDKLAYSEAKDYALANDIPMRNLQFETPKFFEENYVTPCKELLGRLKEARGGFDYGKFITSNLISALRSRAGDNPRLLFQLHVIDFCQFLCDSETKLIKKLFD